VRKRAEQFSWTTATDQMLAALQVIPARSTLETASQAGVAERAASQVE